MWRPPSFQLAMITLLAVFMAELYVFHLEAKSQINQALSHPSLSGQGTQDLARAMHVPHSRVPPLRMLVLCCFLEACLLRATLSSAFLATWN